MSLRWDISTFADAVAAVVCAREADLRLEQAVYGIDSADELTLHQQLALGLSKDWTVAREVHYPSSVGRKLSHRQRCDLVLTPFGRPLRVDAHPPGLFDPIDVAEPDEGLWVEVKIAYQFREGGVRHGGYGAQWRNGVVTDLQKMSAEPKIREAALLLLVFGESEGMLEKDLALFETVLIEKEVLAGFRQVRMVPITERIGHRVCGVAAFPTIQRTGEAP